MRVISCCWLSALFPIKNCHIREFLICILYYMAFVFTVGCPSCHQTSLRRENWATCFSLDGVPLKCLAQGHNKRTYRLVLHHLPLNAERQAGNCEYRYHFFKSYGMTRQGEWTSGLPTAKRTLQSLCHGLIRIISNYEKLLPSGFPSAASQYEFGFPVITCSKYKRCHVSSKKYIELIWVSCL